MSCAPAVVDVVGADLRELLGFRRLRQIRRFEHLPHGFVARDRGDHVEHAGPAVESALRFRELEHRLGVGSSQIVAIPPWSSAPFTALPRVCFEQFVVRVRSIDARENLLGAR